MNRIKIVVVDDNATRREEIKSLLPDYADVFTSGYGDNAMRNIKPDDAGVIPDLVILNGDDSKGLGLYTFDWMINKSGSKEIADIPVIVLCSDEFSDRSLDFLEIGDVSFYEGNIDEDRLFETVTEVIDRRDFIPEPVEPVYEEEKSLDRLMGQTVKVTPSIPGKERKVVLDMDTQLLNLEAALERGRRRTEEIRTVLQAASNGNADEVAETLRHKKKSSGSRTVSGGSGFLKTLKKEHGIVDAPVTSSGNSANYIKTGFGCVDEDIPEEFRYKRSMDKLSELRRKAVENPSAAMNAQNRGNAFANAGTQNPRNAFANAGTQNRENAFANSGTRNPANALGSSGGKNQGNFGQHRGSDFSGQVVKPGQINPLQKMRVIVVDDDPRVTGQCSMALSSNYEIICFNSGMMAIDYFIRNTANLLIVDAVMPGMSGKQTVDSIRYQAGGARVPVIYLVGDDYQGPREMLSGNYTAGVLSKPISRGALAMAVDGLFRGR